MPVLVRIKQAGVLTSRIPATPTEADGLVDLKGWATVTEATGEQDPKSVLFKACQALSKAAEVDWDISSSAEGLIEKQLPLLAQAGGLVLKARQQDFGPFKVTVVSTTDSAGEASLFATRTLQQFETRSRLTSA
jgi:hypothetical protein